MNPPPLQVTLLGGFELRHGSETVPIESGRVRSLVARLALRGGAPRSRSLVAAALWPESREAQARTNLRNLIHQLRRAFPEIERYLDLGGSELEWRPGAPVSVDAVEFENALARAGTATGKPDRILEEALALYPGPLLPDHREPWLESERDRLGRLHLAAMERLLRSRLDSRHYTGARALAEQILHHDPLNEPAHRGRITALAALGDRAGASRAYDECESILSSELGVEPGDATRAARRTALAGTGAHASDGVPVARMETVGSGGVREVLVGRGRELEALRAAWNRALGVGGGDPGGPGPGTRTVWVTGEPGIGKTRLVQAFAEEMERGGDRVAQARAYPTLGATAYGPVVTWLRSAALEPVVTAAPAGTRRELRRLLPELGPALSPQEDALTESERRQRLHDAVISVLSLPGGPAALVLDDLQWSDRETVDLFGSVVTRSPRPILVIATVRTGEVGPGHPLERVGARLGAAGRLERLELTPFGLDETAELLRELLGRDVGEEEVRALHRETEGNPLFLVETARSGRPWARRESSPAEGDALSPRIRAVIEARLGILSPEARQVTRAAATIGREFTVSLLLAVSPLDEEPTLRGLDEAWTRALVRDREDGSFDFSHGKIREVAYRTTSPIRRRELHGRIARALERSLSGSEPDPVPDPVGVGSRFGGPADAAHRGVASGGATPDQIAFHYDRGGSAARAVEWYRRAARAAMAVSALDAVRQLLARALELVERLPRDRDRDELELEMKLALGSALVALEGYGRRRPVEAYEGARELCVRLGRPVTPPILRALALAALARGDLEAGTRFGDELAAAAERDADPVARVEGAYVSGVMAFWKGRLGESERRLREAVEAYNPERHRDHVVLYAQDPKVVCLSRLAWTLWHRGRVAEALARRDEALALAEEHGEPMGLAYGLWFTLFVVVEQGDLERLASQTEALKRVASAHHLVYAETVADGFLGYHTAARGDPRNGIGRMREILADPRWAGMEYVLKLQTLYLVAKAAVAAGDVRTARDTVAEALDYLGSGPSIWRPALRRIEARSVAAEDRTGDRALPAFRAALQTARGYDSAWTELGVAVDRGRWTLERRGPGRAEARHDLERALRPYDDVPSLAAVAAGRIILERLTPDRSPDRSPHRALDSPD